MTVLAPTIATMCTIPMTSCFDTVVCVVFIFLFCLFVNWSASTDIRYTWPHSLWLIFIYRIALNNFWCGHYFAIVVVVVDAAVDIVVVVTVHRRVSLKLPAIVPEFTDVTGLFLMRLVAFKVRLFYLHTSEPTNRAQIRPWQNLRLADFP